MKKYAFIFLVLVCVASCAFCATSCVGSGKCTLLGSPAEAEALSYSERLSSGEFTTISDSAEDFAAKFACAAYSAYDSDGNLAVSPVSVYMALALATECADGETKAELLSALGISFEALQNGFSDYYRSIIADYKSNTKKTTGRVALGNSVWVNDGTEVNADCIEELAEKFFCYSYSADFDGDNKNANLAVKDFVKKQTEGLIDKDFNLSTDTLFTLINTLYLKDIWNKYGDDLSFTSDKYDFRTASGVQAVNLLQGAYLSGRAYETKTFSTFYTSAYNGTKIKFMVPKDGYSVDVIFTSDNIALANSISGYNATDDVNLLRYSTRCLFPKFKASYDGDIKNILSESFGIKNMFDEGNCSFASLTPNNVYCSQVRHVTTLTVDESGIEGAAVTVIEGATSAGPDEYKNVYQDFIVDKSFGFIVTDRYDNTLFSGVIKNV